MTAQPRKQDRSTLDDADWKFIRRNVADRARFHCECCGKYTGMRGQADHIVPRSECEAKGISPKDMANLQWLCAPCHSRKTNRERWAGHKKADRSLPRRARVKGREAYQAAIHQNLNEHSKGSTTC